MDTFQSDMFTARDWYNEAYDHGIIDSYIPLARISTHRSALWLWKAREALKKATKLKDNPVVPLAHIELGFAWLKAFENDKRDDFLAMSNIGRGLFLLQKQKERQEKEGVSKDEKFSKEASLVPGERAIEAKEKLHEMIKSHFDGQDINSNDLEKCEDLEDYLETLNEQEIDGHSLYALHLFNESDLCPQNDFDFLKKASKKGHLLAKIKLSRILCARNDEQSLKAARVLLAEIAQKKLPFSDPLLAYACLCHEGKGGEVDLKGAIWSLEKAYKEFGTPEAGFSLAEIYLEQGGNNTSIALKIMDELATSKTSYVPALLFVGEAFFKGTHGKIKDARTALRYLLNAWDNAEKRTEEDKKKILETLIEIYEDLGDVFKTEKENNTRRKIYIKASEIGHMQAMLSLAKQLEKTHPKESAAYYEGCIKNNVPEALIPLGMMHLQGRGTKKDCAAGLELLLKAEDKMDAHQLFNVFTILKKEKHPQTLAWLKKAADKEHTEALKELSSIYLNTKSPEYNWKAGVGLLEKLANVLKDPKVMVRLADLYGGWSESDQKEGKDFAEKSHAWTEQAALAGDLESQDYLGRLAETSEKFDLAEKWYGLAYKAAPQKYAHSFWKSLTKQGKVEESAKVLRENPHGLLGFYNSLTSENDLKEMLDRAVGAKIPAAMLFASYLKGKIADPKELARQITASPYMGEDFAILGNYLGEKKEEALKFKKFLKSLRRAKDSASHFILAHCFDSGHVLGVSNIEKAARLYIKAAKGNAQAAFKAGEMYQFGFLGEKESREKALEFYRQALSLERHHSQAGEALANLTANK